MAVIASLSFLLVQLKKNKRSDEPERPPHFAQLALRFLLTEDAKDNVIGDLTEEYAEKQTELGRRGAQAWYYKQALLSMAPLLWHRVRRLSRSIVSGALRRFGS